MFVGHRLSLSHLSGTWNLGVAPRDLENLWIPVLIENLIKVALCFIDTVNIVILKFCASFPLSVLEGSGIWLL